jgi:hypothetical protein
MQRKPLTDDSSEADVPFLLALGITIGWILLCSIVFCQWEKWTFFQACYYFFQSLTTIGFGKYLRHRYVIAQAI